MALRFCLGLAAAILVAGIARADCANGSCSVANRVSSRTTIRTQSQTVTQAPRVVVVQPTVQTSSTTQTVTTRKRTRLIRR